MRTNPRSASASHAPTAAVHATSPPGAAGSSTLDSNVVSALKSGKGSDVAGVSSHASQSPFLLSPSIVGGDGLTLPLSPSGPSSVGPAHTLAPSHAGEGDTAMDATRECAPAAVSHTRHPDTPNSNLERMVRAKEAEIARLRRTVQELGVQLNNALHTLDARADTAAELQALKDASAAQDERRVDEVREVRLDMLESRVKLRTREAQLASKYEGDVQARATELLATHTKEVHEENFELLKEKLLLAQEVATSRAVYKELQDSYRKLRRETDLDENAKTELLQRSVQQKTQIAALRQQVKTCEDNLDKVVSEYDRTLKEQERNHQATVLTLTKERDDARRDALRLKRELNQLRSTAGTVLAQLSDLDDFFYAALDEVRRRVVEERRQGLSADQPDATNDAKSASFTPAQTAASILRLETAERLLILGSLNTAPSASSTMDRKGPSKLGAAASARYGAAARGSCSSSALPPVAATSRGARSAPTAAPLDGTSALVSVPNAMPAYLRANVNPTLPLPDEALHTGGARRDDGKEPSGASRRGAPSPSSTLLSSSAPAKSAFRLGGGGGEDGPPPQEPVRSSTPPAPPLPSLRSLPNRPSWKDVKQVDVTSLSWADKERVLQLLFKRIQEERRHRSKMHSNRASDVHTEPPADMDAAQFDRDTDSVTFLTQT